MPGKTFLKVAMGFRLAQSDLTLDDPEGSKNKITVSDVKYVEKRFTLLDPMNMTLGQIGSSSLDLLPKIFGLLVCSCNLANCGLGRCTGGTHADAAVNTALHTTMVHDTTRTILIIFSLILETTVTLECLNATYNSGKTVLCHHAVQHGLGGESLEMGM